MGPTASGKSGLAVELARQFPAEIVNVDSALVYRGMDIGTAKPDQAMQAEIPHHLIDIRDPANAYSAADFRLDAIRLIEEISERGAMPLLTGGTMLYFKALKDGLAKLPSADASVRADISEMAAQKGWRAVHQRLSEVDPVAAARIHENDPQRLQRALEVYEISGKTITEWQKQTPRDCPFDLCEIAVVPTDRKMLHETIGSRFMKMLEDGLVEEVEKLYAREDLNKELPSMKAVGYRQVWDFLDGEISYEIMVDKAIIATRQLAKRQFTWLRSWQGLHQIATPDASRALKIIAAGSILD